MNSQLGKSIIFLLLFIQSFNGYSGHVYGGHLSYSATNVPNQFRVELNVIAACLNLATIPIPVDVSNDCNGNIINADLYYYQSELQPNLCTSGMNQLNCGAGDGVSVYKFAGYVTLPSICSNYHLASTIVHSRVSDNTISTNDYYFEIELNNANGIQNTSPILYAPKAPYVNVNTLTTLELGAIDSDNDSLVYSLVSAMSASSTNVQYSSGYSASVPIQGMSIDAETGLFSILPTQVGKYTVTILIEEYNGNGDFTGSSLIDFLVFVGNYNYLPNYAENHFPFFDNSISNFNNFGTNATFLTSPNRINMCVGDQFCFDITLNDTADISDSLFFITNLTDMLPNATLTVTGSNPITATICWTYTPGFENYDVMFMGRDDDCPLYGFEFFRFRVEADKQIGFNYDNTICGDMTVNFNSNQNSPYQWSVLSGDSIVIGTNFSCNNCSSPNASPQFTTTYLVESLNQCNDTDTLTIHVVDTNLGDLDVDILTQDTTVCAGDCIQLNVDEVKYSEVNNFNTYSAANTIFIPSDSTVSSAMFIPSMALSSGTINSNNIAKICIDINHANASSLNIHLISPSGTSFELSTGNGAGANYSNTCFESNGVSNVIYGVPPFSNNYIPEGGPLTNLFVGEQVQGLWKLQVENTSYNAAGMILGWSIYFSEPLIVAGSPDSLSWNNITYMVLPQQADAVICPYQSGQYVLTAYNEFNCFASDTINISVNPSSSNGVDTFFNVYIYQGIINLYNYLSAGAQNNGLWYDSITGVNINNLIKTDSLANPTTFIYTTQNMFGCNDTNYIRFDMFGYCDVPPGAPSPYIIPLPDAGLDSTVNIGLYSGLFNLYNSLNTNIDQNGFWRDSLGVNLSTTSFDPNIFPSGIYYTYVVTNEYGCEDSAKYYFNIVNDLSVASNTDGAYLKVFPNPASKNLQLSFQGEGQYKVHIVNQLGQEVLKPLIIKQKALINLEFLSNGVYFLKVEGEVEQFTQKFIVQH